MFSFTLDKTDTYVFKAENYNGGSTEYDMYIKPCADEHMLRQIGNNENRIDTADDNYRIADCLDMALSGICISDNIEVIKDYSEDDLIFFGDKKRQYQKKY